ncbi:hypothetical protein LIQ05_19400 [Blautia glucerasea]|uniref:hypothetical protein n=1 Tax=Blautia glucerasea TaxID=536633 RepID=UPI001D0105AD|nr:hypothetical protein [Blautia glucerasea]MCB5389110.1 hypothetical protein [Blautia glucerasea]MCB5423538.1 hypothetical protein [Blautia luti]
MEMKNICGKIPVELHERLKLEVEELGISIPKYLEMVIEEHMTRKGEKTNMAELRTVAVQVTEDLFSRELETEEPEATDPEEAEE